MAWHGDGDDVCVYVFVCLPIFTAIYNMIKIIVNEMNEQLNRTKESDRAYGRWEKSREKGRNLGTHKESVGGTHIDI